MILKILSFSCPLIVASFGALFSEYAGCLALFLDGLISLSAFLCFGLTAGTGSVAAGITLTAAICLLITFIFAFFIERFKANKFIAAIALNLLFSTLPSYLSFTLFGSRGVLTSQNYVFSQVPVQIFTLISSTILIALAIIFLVKSRYGLYLRITGSDSEVLISKGVNPSVTRIMSWCLAGFYSSFAGCFLTMRISSFVPNISSGRGWMALAAVFLGKKKPVRMLISVLLFCCADIFSANIQNILPQIPGSVVISFPYLVVLGLVFFNIF